MQTPQALDATHSDEMFPVERGYIGNKLRSAKGLPRRSNDFGLWGGGIPIKKTAQRVLIEEVHFISSLKN
jgi:hypothetical protein